MKRRGLRLSLVIGSCVTAAVSATSPTSAAPRDPGPATGITVQASHRYQVVNGFGFSEAFRQSVITALPGPEQQQLMSLLFDPVTGAGMSIVRFGLGGAGDVGDQVWLGRPPSSTACASSTRTPGALRPR